MRPKLNKIERCGFCSADGNEVTREELMEKISSCTNCKVDIALKGQWTGDGWRAVQRWNARVLSEQASKGKA